MNQSINKCSKSALRIFLKKLKFKNLQPGRHAGAGRSSSGGACAERNDLQVAAGDDDGARLGNLDPDLAHTFRRPERLRNHRACVVDEYADIWKLPAQGGDARIVKERIGLARAGVAKRIETSPIHDGEGHL